MNNVETKSIDDAAAQTLPRGFERRFQSYRGTWAWLIQRISAICLFLLIPIKIYSGWARKTDLPFPEAFGSAGKIHTNTIIDAALLFFFLLHGFYGLRVILIDFGIIRENRWFWRTLTLALGIFCFLTWLVYFHYELGS
jgi:succinate dehydrogenase hydrophobic anchor subunit